jgi:hypothetical protein
MKVLPRLVFWLGMISLGFGIILKLVCHFSSPVSGPFGIPPGSFMFFSLVCFTMAIAYCVVFIFTQQKE